MGERAVKTIKGAAAALSYILIYFLVIYLTEIEAFLFEADTVNASGITTIVSIFAAFLIYDVTFDLRGTPKKDVYSISAPKTLDVIFSVTMAAGFRMMTSAYMLWAENIKVLSESMESALNPEFNFETMTSFAAMTIIIATCIAAPVFEEILFRGIVMRELNMVMPAPLSIILQGLFFGIVHFVLVQSIFAAVFGVILGYVYYKTKNLSIVMIAHIAFNMSSVLEIKDVSVFFIFIGALITTLSVAMITYRHKNQLQQEL